SSFGRLRTRVRGSALGDGLGRLAGALVHAGAGGALGDARRLAAAAAQVIELGAADLAAAHQLDAGDPRAVEREDALDAFAVGDLAHGEGGVQPGILAGDADALEGLDALARALDHLDVDDDRVARAELRHRGGGQLGDLLLLELGNGGHGCFPSTFSVVSAA